MSNRRIVGLLCRGADVLPGDFATLRLAATRGAALSSARAAQARPGGEVRRSTEIRETGRQDVPPTALLWWSEACRLRMDRGGRLPMRVPWASLLGARPRGLLSMG